MVMRRIITLAFVVRAPLWQLVVEFLNIYHIDDPTTTVCKYESHKAVILQCWQEKFSNAMWLNLNV